jgi:hypothetical protein
MHLNKMLFLYKLTKENNNHRHAIFIVYEKGIEKKKNNRSSWMAIFFFTLIYKSHLYSLCSLCIKESFHDKSRLNLKNLKFFYQIVIYLYCF